MDRLHGVAGQPVSPTSAAVAPPETVPPWTLYSPGQRRRMLFVLFLVGTLTYIDRNIVSILIEPLKAEFGLSDTQVGLVSGIAFAFFYAILGLPISNFADRSNRKLLTIVSLTFWSALTAITGLAQNFWHLILCRMGVGAAESASVPASQSLIADYFPPSDRGKALAGYTMCTAIAYVIALAGGGWIAENYGWRATVFACGVLGAPIALLCTFGLSEPRHKLGFINASSPAEPLLPGMRKLMAKPAYRQLLIAMVIYFSISQGALIFMPSFLIRVHDLSVARVGLLYSIVATTASIGGTLIGGYLTDWMAKKDIAWIVRMPAFAMLGCIPLYELAMVTQSLTVTLMLLALALVLVASMLPALFTAIHAICGSARRALAIALAMAVGNLLGMSLGPVLTGALSDALAVPGDYGEGLRRSLALMFLLFLPGGWILLRAARHTESDAED